jgi:hypothetical protein
MMNDRLRMYIVDPDLHLIWLDDDTKSLDASVPFGR